MPSILIDLIRSRSGNFTVMTALALPVLLGTAGMAIDATNMMMLKTQLQDATDAASLAVSSGLANGTVTPSTGQTFGKNFVGAELAGSLDDSGVAAVQAATTVAITTTAVGSSGKSFNVAVNSTLDVSLTPLTTLVFGQAVSVSTMSKTTSGTGTTRKGVSMDVLLDQSGSMATAITRRCTSGIVLLDLCVLGVWEEFTKADALKQAASALFDGLSKADPNNKLIRTGAITYANGMLAQTPMAWGTATARSWVNALPKKPTGGTDATNSMTTATSNIAANIYKTDKESVEHKKLLNDSADRVIVLMTDGEMTGDTDSWKANIDQNVRNACAAAKTAGIRIYTVAFMAPEKGQTLLKFCASNPGDYYESNTMDALVTAFAAIAEQTTRQPARLTN